MVQVIISCSHAVPCTKSAPINKIAVTDIFFVVTDMQGEVHHELLELVISVSQDPVVVILRCLSFVR